MSKTVAKKKPTVAKVVKPKGDNWFDRFKVRMKLRAPEGIILSQRETEALVAIQQEDVQVLKSNQQEVLSALGVTHSVNLRNQIKKASEARMIAARSYKQTKDPIKKREWARRLVVATTTVKNLSSMTERMSATRDRLEMIRGDVELQIVDAEARVAETEAYAKAGNQLRLVGETLVSARSRAKNNKIEYTNLEVTMEGVEKVIDDSDPDDLLEKADALLGIVPGGEDE